MPPLPSIDNRSRRLVAKAHVRTKLSRTCSPDTGSFFKPPQRAPPLRTVYNPIDSDKQEIRLINLFPGQGNDVVRCSVQTTSLLSETLPDYDTVSYRWDDKVQDCFIFIDGKKELAKGSAVRVLRYLRDPAKCRVLWIDAVSIDQCNLTERGAQVSFMGDIYRHGRKNLVWLGEDENMVSGKVEEELRRVLRNKTLAMKDDMQFRQLMVEPEGAELQDGQELDPSIKMAPLQVLYECEWFCRLWVAQEATLASRSVCHFGQHSFPLPDVLDAAVWLLYNKSMLSDTLQTTTGIHAARAMWYLLDRKNDPDRDLFMAYILAQNFQAGEKRDHVYALLGLYKDQRPGLGLRGKYLRPDYEKSVGDVFRDATRACIEDSGNLQILQFVQPSKVMAGSPSWTLMFNSGPSGMDADPLCKLGNGFNADDSISNEVCFRDGNTLRVLGTQIDAVRSYCSSFTPARAWATREHAKHMKMIRTEIRQHRSPGGDWETELGLILTAGSNIEPNPLKQDFRAFLKYCAGGHPQPPVVNGSQEVDNHHSRASRWYTRFEETAYGRRFFMTESGLAGLGPRKMRCRDVIVVLRGASVPFVLRPRPTLNPRKFKLVGACYVYGLMHGEAGRYEADWLNIV